MQLVIFDCDGVLVDTEPIGARVGAQVLSTLGWRISPEEMLDRFLGCTEEHFRSEVEARIGRTLDPDWEKEFEPLHDAAYEAELTIVAGVDVVLDELESLGVATCVASNGGHDKMRRTLGLTGLHERFAGRIFSAQDVPHGKPAPDLYLHAARTMGAEPGECVVVEDSPRGVEAARAAGMRCLGYAGLTPRERLAGPGVTVCTTMAHVLDELREMLPSRA